MSSNRKIHYIGTDPNPDNYDPINRYEYVGEFYKKHCGNKFFDDNNTYEVHQQGSEDFDFGEYKGKLDFIISSITKDCGFSSMNDIYKCNYYKPLISQNLIN